MSVPPGLCRPQGRDAKRDVQDAPTGRAGNEGKEADGRHDEADNAALHALQQE